MKVYISGKITGSKNYAARFCRAEEKLKKFGFEVINPAAVSAVLPPLSYNAYLYICAGLLREAEAIYMLPDWKNSKGAQFERKLAAALGLKEIFTLSYDPTEVIIDEKIKDITRKE